MIVLYHPSYLTAAVALCQSLALLPNCLSRFLERGGGMRGSGVVEGVAALSLSLDASLGCLCMLPLALSCVACHSSLLCRWREGGKRWRSRAS